MKTIRLDYADIRFPPPAQLVESLARELRNSNLYPRGEYRALKEAYAAYAGISEGQLLPGNGLDEVIDMVTRTWGKRVLIPAPTFSQFELAAKRQGSMITLSNCFDGESYALRFADSELRRASLVWVCSPNNPTGTKIPRERILEVVEAARGIVCVDEAYYEFSRETVMDLIGEYGNLVVLRGLSKGFGLAGLKIGFAASNAENIFKLERMRQIFNINRLAEKAGAEVFNYSEYYAQARESIARARDSFAIKLQELGFSPLPSCANFLLVKFSSINEAESIFNGLKGCGVIALPAWDGEFTGLNGPFIRFSIATEPEMEEAARRLERIVCGGV